MEITDKKLWSLGSPMDRLLPSLFGRLRYCDVTTGVSSPLLALVIQLISEKFREKNWKCILAMSECRETFWDGQVHMNVQINIFYTIFSSPVFKILAVFMLEISINNCSRQLYLVFSLSTNRWYFLPDHVISNCVTRSSTSRLYAIKRLVHNLSFTLHVTLPLPVPSPLTLRARAPAPAR